MSRRHADNWSHPVTIWSIPGFKLISSLDILPVLLSSNSTGINTYLHYLKDKIYAQI